MKLLNQIYFYLTVENFPCIPSFIDRSGDFFTIGQSNETKWNDQKNVHFCSAILDKLKLKEPLKEGKAIKETPSR